MWNGSLCTLHNWCVSCLFEIITSVGKVNKLHANLLGKWPNFAKPNPSPDPDVLG